MDICQIQQLLKVVETGEYDQITVAAVKNFQLRMGIPPTGLLDDKTLNKLKNIGYNEMEIINHNDIGATSDLSESKFIINTKLLDSNQYNSDKCNKIEYIFIHHTAGWHDPIKVIEDWNTDQRGKIGTQFVIGGSSITNNDNVSDGKVVQCIPDLYWAAHLGSFKEHGININMHKNSIGIELCNFGWLTKKGSKYITYSGQTAHNNQVTNVSFRGYDYWHDYSDKQLDSLYNLIIYLANKYNVDVQQGLPYNLKNSRPAFEWSKEACDGKIKGLLSHTNVRKDKFDVYPNKKLINLLMKI